MELFIDRCLEIDVEIKIEESGDVKIDESKGEKEDDATVDESDIFGIDLDPSDETKQGKKKEELDPMTEVVKSVDEMADKVGIYHVVGHFILLPNDIGLSFHFFLSLNCK